VLLGMDFNDERKLGDAKARDTVLARLVQHFSALDLRNSNLSEPDLLGRAYEYLIEKFADDARVRRENGPTRRQGSPSAVSSGRSCLSGHWARQCEPFQSAPRRCAASPALFAASPGPVAQSQSGGSGSMRS